MKLMYLFLDDCAGRAGIDASAALKTCAGVNLVVIVAHMDSTGRASIGASAASDAIAGDIECHKLFLLGEMMLSPLNYNIYLNVCNYFYHPKQSK